MALDIYGRRLHYLRISLTDHCNLRCLYCMPEEMSFRPNAELMQDDEILLLVRVFASLGFDKLRLTGGEPTVRTNLVNLVEALTHVSGVTCVTMTTNGMLFSRMAESLARAGLHRANFSVDTLDPVKFQHLTRWGKIEHLWEGIRAAERTGMTPIKLNSVVVRGYNEADVVDLARLTLEHPWQVRFIELMPFAGATDLQVSQLVTAQEIRSRLEAEVGPLETVNGGRLDGEARMFRFAGSPGQVGLIASVTQPFCASCSRARLTADGRLRLCLLREGEVDLLTPLRNGATFQELQDLVREGLWGKPWGHRLAVGDIPMNRTMSEIGG